MAPQRSRTLIGLAGAFVTGAFIVGQARVNAELGAELGDGILAAVICSVSGWCCC